jgi:hypothetical protein
MAAGKFLRYLALTALLLRVSDDSWRALLNAL